MFSKRFLKVPIKVYDKDHMDLTGTELTKDTYEKILPYSIESYRPSDENNGRCLHLSLKSGATMLVYMSVEEFERQLDKYADWINEAR